MPVKLMSFTDKPEELIAKAYGICTHKKVDVSRIPYWIDQGHETPLEHAVATFYIDGISRTCSHQLVRHRLVSFNQESQRYVELDEGAYPFVFPPNLGSEAYDELKFIIDDCVSTYYAMIEAGAKKEDARFALPEATQTRLIATANFREWRHVIKLRTSRHAQWEIRKVANEILNQLYEVAPYVFGDLKEKE